MPLRTLCVPRLSCHPVRSPGHTPQPDLHHEPKAHPPPSRGHVREPSASRRNGSCNPAWGAGESWGAGGEGSSRPLGSGTAVSCMHRPPLPHSQLLPIVPIIQSPRLQRESPHQPTSPLSPSLAPRPRLLQASSVFVHPPFPSLYTPFPSGPRPFSPPSPRFPACLPLCPAAVG